MSSDKVWERVYVCPFCFSGVREEYAVCCGEYGHAEWMYQDEDGEILTQDEYDSLDLKNDKETKHGN